ncbi:uncharacterized protein [Spinacia oleracea]|uniref:Retrovirus-related Pol polyprotein from transposon TNT 1-94-like beta-barrel domain-containing protein n=1 Tax=Spinacia oleracea TaxID=3562 RepID=A0ABM3RRS4_SPIOL|nr:uncharacterized protein LOC130471971 [Spinacia oleracea]
MAKITALQETKDFTKFNMEQLVGSLLTHELQLNARPSETPINRALALKTKNDENSKDDEETALFARRFRRMFRNFKDGEPRDKPNRKFPKADSGCHKCGNLEHRITECPFWEQERGKGKEPSKDKYSENWNTFSKTEVRKEMIAAWGDSSSDEEQEQPNEEKAHMCLVAKSENDGSDSESDKFQVEVRGKNTWYLDSGCSKHMKRDINIFFSLTTYEGGTVTFGDNKKGNIIAIGKVGKSKSHSIDNVLLVEGLGHSLISISQFVVRETMRNSLLINDTSYTVKLRQ